MTRIRATHPYAFRSGEWAEVQGSVAHPKTGHECYLIRFPDGMSDFWVIGDSSAGYEFA